RPARPRGREQDPRQHTHLTANAAARPATPATPAAPQPAQRPQPTAPPGPEHLRLGAVVCPPTLPADCHRPPGESCSTRSGGEACVLGPTGYAPARRSES